MACAIGCGIVGRLALCRRRSRRMGDGTSDPETLLAWAQEYGAEVDFERTSMVVEHHGLVF
jgi:hypothetical protein